MKEISNLRLLSPVLFEENKSVPLEAFEFGDKRISEDFVQNAIYEAPSLLSVGEIDETYNGLIPLCRELNLGGIYADDCFINEDGYITIAECKLCRNQQSRREVIGQLLDYAKELSRLSYDQFEKSVLKARKGAEKSLYDIVSKQTPPKCSEADFKALCERNLRNGKFLLLVVGDDVRKEASDIIDFVNLYSRMSFTLAIVATRIYKLPGKESFIIIPDCLAKTQIVNLHVINEYKEYSAEKKSLSVGDIDFYDCLKSSVGNVKFTAFKKFEEVLVSDYDLNAVSGRGVSKAMSYKLNSDTRFNVLNVRQDGVLYFFGLERTDLLSEKELQCTRKYFDEIATRSGFCKKSTKDMFTTNFVNANNEFLKVDFLLENEQWYFDLLDKFIASIRNY